MDVLYKKSGHDGLGWRAKKGDGGCGSRWPNGVRLRESQTHKHRRRLCAYLFAFFSFRRGVELYGLVGPVIPDVVGLLDLGVDLRLDGDVPAAHIPPPRRFQTACPVRSHMDRPSKRF